MITVDIRGLDEVQRQLRNLAQEQMPYAISVALNNTAFSLLKTSKQQLTSVFDRPTPLIQGATRVTKATKKTLAALIEIDPKRQGVLGVHEAGGPRGQKGFERKIGLPEDWRAVPTKNMPRNEYGNPDPAINNRIITAKGGKARGIYFIMPGANSRQRPGIYQLIDKTKIAKLYHFVRRVQYEPRLEWMETIRTEAERILPEEMSKAVQRAMETAR